MEFLPICKQDMIDRGWEQCDFVYVIGDAYVDNHSFGHAIISRILESHGYTVGLIPQPDWKNPKSIDIYGKPLIADPTATEGNEETQAPTDEEAESTEATSESTETPPQESTDFDPDAPVDENGEDMLETIEDDDEFEKIADIFDDEFSDIFYDDVEDN